MIYDMLTNPDKLTNHDTLTKYVDWIILFNPLFYLIDIIHIIL